MKDMFKIKDKRFKTGIEIRQIIQNVALFIAQFWQYIRNRIIRSFIDKFPALKFQIWLHSSADPYLNNLNPPGKMDGS